MVRGKAAAKAYLSPSDIEAVEDEKHELENVIREVEGGAQSGQRVDVGKIKAEIAHLNRVIEEGSAPEARGKDKDKLAAEEADLAEELRKGMPTQWEMRKPSLNPGAVKKHIRWGERNFNNIKRWVEIQRMLRPDEPRSIENLRNDK